MIINVRRCENCGEPFGIFGVGESLKIDGICVECEKEERETEKEKAELGRR